MCTLSSTLILGREIKNVYLMHSNLQLYQEEEDENWHQHGDVNIFFLYKIPFMTFILL